MEIKIEITDRNYEQIKEFCDFNSIKIEDYIVQCVEDDYFTRKYGDLNEKIHPKANTPSESDKKKYEEDLKKELDKIASLKKERTDVEKVNKEAENKAETLNIEDIITNTEQMIIRKEDVINTSNNNVRKKRTLKAK